MNQIDRLKILKMLGIMVLLFLMVSMANHFHKKHSMTLEDYAKLHPAETEQKDEADATDKVDAVGKADATDKADAADKSSTPDELNAPSTLTGALLNGGADGKAMLEQRVSSANSSSFYYEPLSESLRRYITGISYPAADAETSVTDTSESGTSIAKVSVTDTAVSYDDLRYVHILHYNFDGVPVEGELICNAVIAQDLLEIFYELYRNEYQIEKILLIEEYDGDTAASMEADNSYCFASKLTDSDSATKHALGLAIDINPLYNPSIAYNKDGSRIISPTAAEPYADRKLDFAYKIDENDLCYKLFTKHEFIWGGNWNSEKDYQHFQK